MAARLRRLDLVSPAGRPPLRAGVAVAVGSVAAVTAVIFALREVAPVVSTGVVYMLAVLVVAVGWGTPLATATAFLSALAFNFFHLPPTGRLAIAEDQNWVALLVFLAVAIVAGRLADAARSRALEAVRRRREADALAEAARVLLGSTGADDARSALAGSLSRAFALSAARVELRTVAPREREEAVALVHDGSRLGTLIVPASTAADALASLHRLSPSLAALLAAARRREALEGELVDTEALRRSDVLKTALLRSVSHDLRSPLTAIVTAAAGIRGDGADEVELAALVREEAGRLTGLVDQLLDLSKLEAGSATPSPGWVAPDELVEVALSGLPRDKRVTVELEPDLPLVQVDPAQLERALANLLDNALRHGGGETVELSVRRAAHRLRIRVSDAGPGVPEAARERIFEPFFRADDATAGSGLGLAIARGLVEANGGALRLEHGPRGGASFVVELPLRVAPPRTAAARER